MKKCLTLLAAFIALILTIGCSTYHYVSFNSELPQDFRNEMVSDLDSVIVRHLFSEDNQILFEISNRSGQMLYVDKTRSFLILGEESFPIWQDVTHTNLAGKITESGQYSNRSFINAHSTSIRDLAVVAIPPGTRISESAGVIPNINYDEKSDHEKVTIPGRGAGFNGKVYRYNEDNSPLSLRVYLTLYFDQDFVSRLTIDERFWVSEIVKTDMGPGYRNEALINMVVQTNDSGDKAAGFFFIGALFVVLFVAM
ncbi:hypothetical protein [Alkalitalea saponilacus]|uniref:Uncharacterized protein n=1 Tax=Alkalitalea saponilacus TaxID=889453 RepID=A0A1T5BTQ6_9BACT|nr:hypothetical protein [Alkalitalea saponilacus]ASB49602.1 hypothetical protein CDL62_10835 [Alkalitalea saponilacus]SKB50499.1 hypothetical protein SAMN03080601_00620 [Alkalitalea saponilacus]